MIARINLLVPGRSIQMQHVRKGPSSLDCGSGPKVQLILALNPSSFLAKDIGKRRKNCAMELCVGSPSVVVINQLRSFSVIVRTGHQLKVHGSPNQKAITPGRFPSVMSYFVLVGVSLAMRCTRVNEP